MAEVKFYLEKRKDKQGKLIVENVAILLFYSFNGQRLQYFTGERIDTKNAFASKDPWTGPVKLPIKSSAPNASTINTNLKTLKLKVDTIDTNARALGEQLTPAYFKTRLDAEYKSKTSESGKKAVSFLEAFEEYQAYGKKYKAYSTYQKSISTKKHLEDFLGEAKLKKLKFSDIDTAFADAFKDHLISKPYKVNDEVTYLLNNTVVKYLHELRTFLSWCKNEPRCYFKGEVKISGKENDIDVIFLSKEEVDHLAEFPMHTESLDRVRDVYVFGCYTGLRYSDIFKLKKDDIKGKSIKFYIQKGGSTVSHTVPLIGHSEAILAKYADNASEKALPVMSNQKMNQYIKEVMKVAGFTENVTIAEKQGNGKVVEKVYKKYELIGVHTSRKSFVSIAFSLGFEEAVIKSLTGHSKNSRAFSKYYHINEELKAEAMKKFEKKSKPIGLMKAI